MERNLEARILAAYIILLLLMCTVTTSTAASGESSTITVGKSGAVDYLTTNYKTDSACIQAALNAAKSGDTIIVREGKYNLVNQVSQQNKDLCIIGEGDVIFNINTGIASQPAFYIYGKKIDTEYLAINADKGKTQIVLNDASNVQKFDLIKIWKDVQWCPDDYPQQKTGEMYLIESVSGNTVTLNQPLIRDYSTSDNSVSEIYRPIRVQIDNIKFQNCDSTGDLEGLALRYCKDSSITNCWFDDNGQASIRLFSCFNVEVTGNFISDSNRAGRGYGVSIADATAFVNIHDNQIENCRHCIMSGTGKFKALNRDIIIWNNTLVGSSVTDANVIDAHPMTIDYTVTENTIYPKPGFYAFYDGTLKSVFSDNYVYGGGGVKRRGSVDDGQHIIKDNRVEGGTLYQTAGNGVGDTLQIISNVNENSVYGVNLYNEDYRNVVIEKNTFNSLSVNGILLAMQPTTTDSMNVTISNNIISNAQKNGMYLKRSNANNKMNLEIKNNTIKNVNLVSEYHNGIYLVDTWRANVENNFIYDEKGTMYLGIRETGSNADWNYIHDNIISGGSKSIRTVGKNTICENNFDPAEAPVNHAPINDAVIKGNISDFLPLIQDSRLREDSPGTVFKDVPYIDLGGMDGVGAYRNLLLFDLSEYDDSDMIEKATLSLFWYYPAGIERPEDTIVEIYRPKSWNPSYVTWNNCDLNKPWGIAGGEWFGKNNVAQGSIPYATITLKGSNLPDNSYHELDVTDLVKEYVSGKYENTGFLIKARTESGNYVAFYSSDCGNESQIPKLKVTKKTVYETITGTNDNRLREASPETVFQDKPFIDVGGMSVGRYRDVMLFNLRDYTNSDIINATLYLCWYYPEGSSRPEDTVIEVYRPASTWNPNYVSWNKKDKDIEWSTSGGDWYDKNSVLQGSAPYAILTLEGSDIPDNRYYKLDVTDLVKEYTSGKYENTGFLIKARTESNNYIAFYSSDCGNESQMPKLILERRM
ncbi:disaggregatase related repeat-containing protein [Methanosarcina sp. WWM596]|uniref:disaggregatase related repeat-containing protein n=1 Tax=Methanosarcina sp. WWM596 TaxID=1434103 RepID=UPI0006159ACE|nr:disaggregatase related repeat-containing protein [Methanosarcina sp. WWM596]AKB17636.1 hypothetical protein MSWHS_0773 [Methanosarcina sp. WWM596]